MAGMMYDQGMIRYVRYRTYHGRVSYQQGIKQQTTQSTSTFTVEVEVEVPY
jgi:hypothetical protein